MIIDPKDQSTKDNYKLLIGSIVPRPIAWVSTVNKNGEKNLAPFSFFTVASREPAMLCISIGPGAGEREGTIKDTLANIRETKEFVINIVSLPQANAMKKSSDNHQPSVDEFEHAGLTAVPSVSIQAPRVKESAVNMECTLDQIITLGSDHLVIGRLEKFHVRDDLYENGRIDPVGLQPLARMAGGFSLVEKFFTLPHSDVEGLLEDSKKANKSL